VPIDPEAESLILKERSVELTEMLDAAHPTVVAPADVWAESRRLGQVAAQARRVVASRVANGRDPGPDVTVGKAPPIRRVRTDRRGHDLDPLHGRACITSQLLSYWTHRKDVLAPAVEGSYREAAERLPYRPALASAAQGHLGVLRERRAMLSEHGIALEASLAAYDNAYVALRQNANSEPAAIATEAQNRLDSLRREAAEAVLGGDQVKGLLAAAVSQVTDPGVLDADTGMPLVRVNPRTGLPVG
jgi:hypothetical protein